MRTSVGAAAAAAEMDAQMTATAAAAVEAWAESGPTMGQGYDRIAKRLYAIDELSEYEHLERALKLDQPAHRADYATLIDALDAAEDNARRAHQLYVNACVALESFEIDARIIEGGMREKVVALFQAQKAEGTRTKQITEGDVEAEILRAHPDQVRDLTQRRSRSKKMVEHFERLADLWKARARALEVMVSTMRR